MKKKIIIILLILIPTLIWSQENFKDLTRSFLKAHIWNFFDTVFFFAFVLNFITFILHIGRLYINRIVDKFPTKYFSNSFLSAYLTIRDLLLIVTFTLSAIFIFPGFFGIYGQYLTYFSISVSISLFFALIIKSYFNVEINSFGFKIYNCLICAGFVFNILSIYRI